MIMFNRLPYSVILNGKKHKINVDYRKMISLESKIQDRRLDNAEKIQFCIRSFYPDFFLLSDYNALLNNPQLYKEACNKLIWFYKCGREDYHKKGIAKNSNSVRIYSYEFDDEYIYGAFYEQYKIDLSREFLHWWKFKALLKSLKDDTEFVKIKGYRAYHGKDENMNELKNYWELPKLSNEEERLNALYEALK